VILSVQKQPGADTLALTAQIEGMLKRLQAALKNSGIKDIRLKHG